MDRKSSVGPTATSAQLKDDIDSGRTGDKTPGFDPAAAPLGTDDEAGGAPPSPELIARAREVEQSAAALPKDKDRTAPADASAAPAGKPPSQWATIRGLSLGGGAAVLVVGLLGYLGLHH